LTPSPALYRHLVDQNSLMQIRLYSNQI